MCDSSLTLLQCIFSVQTFRFQRTGCRRAGTPYRAVHSDFCWFVVVLFLFLACRLKIEIKPSDSTTSFLPNATVLLDSQEQQQEQQKKWVVVNVRFVTARTLRSPKRIRISFIFPFETWNVVNSGPNTRTTWISSIYPSVSCEIRWFARITFVIRALWTFAKIVWRNLRSQR